MPCAFACLKRVTSIAGLDGWRGDVGLRVLTELRFAVDPVPPDEKLLPLLCEVDDSRCAVLCPRGVVSMLLRAACDGDEVTTVAPPRGEVVATLGLVVVGAGFTASLGSSCDLVVTLTTGTLGTTSTARDGAEGDSRSISSISSTGSFVGVGGLFLGTPQGSCSGGAVPH